MTAAIKLGLRGSVSTQTSDGESFYRVDKTADSPLGIGAMVYVPREVQEHWRQKERNRRSKFNKILSI
jgi:hypothetical protein